MKTFMRKLKSLTVPLLLPFFLFLSLMAVHASNLPSLKLQAGDTFSYQWKSVGTWNESTDSIKENYWITISVHDLMDSVYRMELRIDRQQRISSMQKMDTRSGYYSEMQSPLLHVPVPFTITKNRKLVNVELPEVAIRERINEFSGDDILENMQLSMYYDRHKTAIYGILDRIFASWDEPDSESQQLTYVRSGTNQYRVNHSYVVKQDSLDKKLEQNPYQYHIGELKLKGSYLIDKDSHMASEVFYQQDTKSYAPSQSAIVHQSINIQLYKPNNQVKLHANVAEDYKGDKLHIFMFRNFIEYDIFEWETALKAGKTYTTNQTLKRPIALSIKAHGADIPHSFNNLLLEPGDDITLELTEDSIYFTGKGALKNTINLYLLKQALKYDNDWPETKAKAECDQQIKRQLAYLSNYEGKISEWAYQHLQSDIYYGNLERLMSYYYSHNDKKVNAHSFNLLFQDIDLNEYPSVSSFQMRNFLDSYLFRKALIMKQFKVNRTISEQEQYYLAEMILTGEAKYLAQTKIVWQALKSNDTEIGNHLFQEYKMDYWQSEFYNRLNKLRTARVNLGANQPFPKVTFTTMDGKKMSTEELKGKYVQLLFINIEYEDRQETMEAYQQFIAEMKDEPFELVTVFVTPDEEKINTYIKEHQPQGILVANPDWKIEELKQFKMEYGSPYFLVNPEGVIIFSGNIRPYNYYLKHVKQYIEQTDFSIYEASLSQRTLYGVLWGALLLIVLIVLVSILVMHNLKRKATLQQQKLEWQMGAVRSQLNPHFLFNAMSSIQFLVNQNDNDKANRFLSSFAKLMRKVLHQSEEEFSTLQEELDTIETYLQLEQLRHKFQYQIKVDKRIDTHNTEVPVMLIQPFVENSILHGIAHLKEKGKVSLQISCLQDGRVLISITDNGDGFSVNGISSSTSNGKGMALTQKRMNLLMQKYHTSITFEVLNLKDADPDQKGTQVKITFETEV